MRAKTPGNRRVARVGQRIAERVNILAARCAGVLAPHIAGALGPHSAGTRLLRPLVNGVLGERFVLVRVASGPATGTRLLVDPQTEKFLWSGHHEHHVLAELARRVQPNDCIWDVGAHIGYVTCFVADRIRLAGRVIAFEPVPETQERLRRTIDANGLQNVTIAPYAVSSTSGISHLFAGSSSATWSLESRQDHQRIAIETLSLDDAAMRYPLPAIVKIDAEGAELDVLRGARELLASRRPALLVEFSNAAMVEQARTELPQYSFDRLGDNHWLLEPAALSDA